MLADRRRQSASIHLSRNARQSLTVTSRTSASPCLSTWSTSLKRYRSYAKRVAGVRPARASSPIQRSTARDKLHDAAVTIRVVGERRDLALRDSRRDLRYSTICPARSAFVVSSSGQSSRNSLLGRYASTLAARSSSAALGDRSTASTFSIRSIARESASSTRTSRTSSRACFFGCHTCLLRYVTQSVRPLVSTARPGLRTYRVCQVCPAMLRRLRLARCSMRRRSGIELLILVVFLD